MKRNLVLTTESARHPFRQRLPMAVTSVEVLSERQRAPVSDLAFIFVSFISCFIIIFGMIV